MIEPSGGEVQPKLVVEKDICAKTDRVVEKISKAAASHKADCTRKKRNQGHPELCRDSCEGVAGWSDREGAIISRTEIRTTISHAGQLVAVVIRPAYLILRFCRTEL